MTDDPHAEQENQEGTSLDDTMRKLLDDAVREMEVESEAFRQQQAIFTEEAQRVRETFVKGVTRPKTEPLEPLVEEIEGKLKGQPLLQQATLGWLNALIKRVGEAVQQQLDPFIPKEEDEPDPVDA